MHPDTQDLDAQAGPDAWITEIQLYHKDNILLDEHIFAEQIIRVAKRYTLVEGDIYRHGANDILLQCITQEDDYELLVEIHGGECGNYTSSHTLVDKSLWAWILLAYSPPRCR
jgi:hypothetical protein